MAALLVPLCLNAQGTGGTRPPIIDMHLHFQAVPAPSRAMCAPIDPFPAWDPARPCGATFMEMLERPP